MMLTITANVKAMDSHRWACRIHLFQFNRNLLMKTSLGAPGTVVGNSRLRNGWVKYLLSGDTTEGRCDEDGKEPAKCA